jgi:hypothetical protein
MQHAGREQHNAIHHRWHGDHRAEVGGGDGAVLLHRCVVGDEQFAACTADVGIEDRGQQRQVIAPVSPGRRFVLVNVPVQVVVGVAPPFVTGGLWRETVEQRPQSLPDVMLHQGLLIADNAPVQQNSPIASPSFRSVISVPPVVNRVVLFSAGVLHRINPFEGERYSVAVNVWGHPLME